MLNHKTKQCPKCLNEFSTRANNYEKHIAVCNGDYKPFKKLTNCKYCELDFGLLTTTQRANHSRWCDKNPKRSEYNTHLEIMRTSKTGTNNHNQFTKARALGLPIPEGSMKGKPGTFAGKYHTEETKQKMREAQIGRVIGAEARANMRLGALTRPKISDETRAKMSAAHKAAWVARKAAKAQQQ